MIVFLFCTMAGILLSGLFNWLWKKVFPILRICWYEGQNRRRIKRYERVKAEYIYHKIKNYPGPFSDYSYL